MGRQVLGPRAAADVPKLRGVLTQLFSAVFAVAASDEEGEKDLRKGGQPGPVEVQLRGEMWAKGATPVWLDFQLRPEALAQVDIDGDGPRVALNLGAEQGAEPYNTSVAPLRRNHARSSR
jgi:hypothetical protein